ncbi:meprin A subunit beta [Megalops cyprinoides]|uniref:meprin A subunit beta n=1 Tax=Megalops cyprinoides TaxID=118141 RepID=UPI001864B7A2|nr:meprin A subunit beta [Megalops cyprinoides]
MASSKAFLILSLLCHQVICLPTLQDIEVDVDGGRDLDIFDINAEAGLDLMEGDIVLDETQGRNSILGDEYRWPTTVPYYLEDSLEINAKGVILKAFEQYRLKTCINFKPWEGEQNYISVFKGSGCFSSVGNRHVGKQRLSIGSNCDRIATIEHEFLHALGFWHEQSRADRDDYVTIMWDQITEGKEHNFNTYDDTVSSSLNVPYDYGSMMHYSKTAFRKGSEPTIVTKIPEFMDVIGQRMEFSDSDLLKLNRLYNCTTSSTFLDTCSFELTNICGMVQGPDDNADWRRMTAVPGGPHSDYTNMGKCKGEGSFMHFSTETGNIGDRAYLESRLLYPKRGSQCLQFYYYHSGSADDGLSVWVREYDQANPKGKLRLIKQITGMQQHSWELHHVTLDVTKKFRVVFEGRKGAGPSSGGLSIDDINLSETECPHHMWRIKNFAKLLATTPPGKKIYSPRFLSREGYTFQVGLYLNGTSSSPGKLAIYFYLTSGEHDNTLKWPCPWKQATMMLMDQNADIRRRMSNQRSITTDPERYEVDANGNKEYFWDDPRKVGSLVIDEDGTKYYRGPGRGTSSFLTRSRVMSRDFIKGDEAIFLLSLEDVSRLLETQPVPPADPCSTVRCEGSRVCVRDRGAAVCRCAAGDESCQRSSGSSRDPRTAVAAASMCALVAMTVVAVVSVMHMRKYKKKLQEMGGGVVLENKTSGTTELACP